jgi:hypothetical protein
VNEKGRPATYRDLKHILDQKFLSRGGFDGLFEQAGLDELIVSLWTVQTLAQRREKPKPEELKRIEAARDYIRQRLPERLYYAAILTVMEALPAGLGEEVPVSVIEQWEKLTAVLGRRNEGLQKRKRRPGAKTKRTPAADIEQEEARRNQVLNAIGAISREITELDDLKKKDVAERIGISERQLRRWEDIYEWDWEVMEFEGATGHGKEK